MFEGTCGPRRRGLRGPSAQLEFRAGEIDEHTCTLWGSYPPHHHPLAVWTGERPPLLDVGKGGRCGASSVRAANADGREQRRRGCVAIEAREELLLTLWVRVARRRRGAVAVRESAWRQRVRPVRAPRRCVTSSSQQTYILFRCRFVLIHVIAWLSVRRSKSVQHPAGRRAPPQSS